jgi:hypothetical protein
VGCGPALGPFFCPPGAFGRKWGSGGRPRRREPTWRAAAGAQGQRAMRLQMICPNYSWRRPLVWVPQLRNADSHHGAVWRWLPPPCLVGCCGELLEAYKLKPQRRNGSAHEDTSKGQGNVARQHGISKEREVVAKRAAASLRLPSACQGRNPLAAQRAMAVAMIYPEPAKLKRKGGSLETKDQQFSGEVTLLTLETMVMVGAFLNRSLA